MLVQHEYFPKGVFDCCLKHILLRVIKSVTDWKRKRCEVCERVVSPHICLAHEFCALPSTLEAIYHEPKPRFQLKAKAVSAEDVRGATCALSLG